MLGIYIWNNYTNSQAPVGKDMVVWVEKKWSLFQVSVEFLWDVLNAEISYSRTRWINANML